MRFASRLTALIAAGAVVCLAAACDPMTPYTAIVNGTRISQKELSRELKAFKANTAFVTAYAQSSQQQSTPRPGVLDTATAGSVYTQSFVAALLGLDIQSQVVHDEVLRRRIEPPAGTIQSAATVDAAGQQFGTDTNGKPIFDAFPGWLRLLFEQRQAEEDALGKALGVQAVSTQAIQQYYAQNQANFITSECVSHILVTTQADAQAAYAQIQGGASFASVASAVSTDTSTKGAGGALGCNPPGEGSDPIDLDQAFVAAATNAPLNTVTQPVQVTNGWDVLVVTQRTIEPLDANMTQAIAQQLQQAASQPLSNFFQQAATTLKVTVNPIYGHWDDQQLAVVAPTAPNAATSGLPTTTVPPSAAGAGSPTQVPATGTSGGVPDTSGGAPAAVPGT